MSNTPSVMLLSKSDYIKILKFYNIRIPTTTKTMKNKAEQILAEKLCKCIKKVGVNNEPKAIGICTRTVINNKGLYRGTFRCIKKTSLQSKRKKQFITLNKRNTNKTRKQ
jgi:hypothetical protein